MKLKRVATRVSVIRSRCVSCVNCATQDFHSNVKDKLDWQKFGLFFSFFLERERVVTAQLATSGIQNDIEQRHCVHASRQTLDYGVETPIDLQQGKSMDKCPGSDYARGAIRGQCRVGLLGRPDCRA